jgi:uncharacterized protein (DUF39 family)
MTQKSGPSARGWVKHVGIVGDGTSGWMCAAALFGMFGRDTQAIRFHQLWLKFAKGGDPNLAPIEDYNLSAVAARLGRFSPTAREVR